MISTEAPKVDTPTTFNVSDTLTESSSVNPSTSKFPLASIAPVNVETPDTLRSSKSLRPSTVKLLEISTEALISTSEANVETPDTLRFPVRVAFLAANSSKTISSDT